MMHGKSGETVNRGTVNREMTVDGNIVPLPAQFLFLVASHTATKASVMSITV